MKKQIIYLSINASNETILKYKLLGYEIVFIMKSEEL